MKNLIALVLLTMLGCATDTETEAVGAADETALSRAQAQTCRTASTTIAKCKKQWAHDPWEASGCWAAYNDGLGQTCCTNVNDKSTYPALCL